MSAIFSNEVQADVTSTVGLTDAELRATPVPISGTVTATPSGTQDVNIVSTVTLPVSGPLTDAELRATPVDVLGPLTDAELRATPVPVTGIITPTSTDTAVVTRVVVSTTVATLAALNADRLRLIVHNETGVLFVKLGASATSTDYTYRLTGNTTLELDEYTGAVTAIKATGTSDAQVTELSI